MTFDPKAYPDSDDATVDLAVRELQRITGLRTYIRNLPELLAGWPRANRFGSPTSLTSVPMARVSDRAVEILALETLDVEQHVIASAHPAYRGLTRGDLRMEQARRGALLQGNA